MIHLLNITSITSVQLRMFRSTGQFCNFRLSLIFRAEARF